MSPTAPEKLSTNPTFDGELVKFSAPANSLGGLNTNFNVFLPKQALDGDKVP